MTHPFDSAPTDSQHGSSGPGGPVFPDPESRHARAESEQPEVRTAGTEIQQTPVESDQPEGSELVRTPDPAIEHPSWCAAATCPVRRHPRGEVGAHVSPWVILDEPSEDPGVVGLQVRLWQFAPIADEAHEPEVDVKIRSVKRTLVHFSLDLEEARTFANVIATLARQAANDA